VKGETWATGLREIGENLDRCRKFQQRGKGFRIWREHTNDSKQRRTLRMLGNGSKSTKTGGKQGSVALSVGFDEEGEDRVERPETNACQGVQPEARGSFRGTRGRLVWYTVWDGYELVTRVTRFHERLSGVGNWAPAEGTHCLGRRKLDGAGKGRVRRDNGKRGNKGRGRRVQTLTNNEMAR